MTASSAEAAGGDLRFTYQRSKARCVITDAFT